MNFKVISRNVGYALLVSALFMLLSIFVSIANGNDSALAALVISFSITFIVGIFPFIFVRGSSNITLKEGYVIIFLSWMLSFVFGMLPYALYGEPFSLANAWFESVSGFTATGGTILDDVEVLPNSLLFWRSSTHFIGGLGIVVFLLLIIPDTSPVRFRLTNMELSSISRDGYRSQTRKMVSIFTYVYLGLIVSLFVCYLIAGMPLFHAVNQAFSVSATGGFSTRTASIGAFDSVAIDIITIVYMFLASVHFGLIFIVFFTRSLRPLANPVFRFYVGMLVTASVVMAVILRPGSTSWGRAFLDGTFHAVSYASTSGFAIADNSQWGMLPCFILLTLSMICGCAGSTTGGIKIDRILVLFKAIGRQIKLAVHPSAVTEIKFGKTVIHDEAVYPQVLFIALYFIIMALSILLCLLVGDPNHHAVSGTISNLGTVGLSVGSIGSAGSYNAEPAAMKFIFTMDMFLGRVEIYPILAVLSSAFSFRRKRPGII